MLAPAVWKSRVNLLLCGGAAFIKHIKKTSTLLNLQTVSHHTKKKYEVVMLQ